jgi:hypothetical protein
MSEAGPAYITLEEAYSLTMVSGKKLLFLRTMKGHLEDGTIRAFALFQMSGKLRAIPADAWAELKLQFLRTDWYAIHIDATKKQFDLVVGRPKVEPVFLPNIWPGTWLGTGALKLRFLKSEIEGAFLKKPRMSGERVAIEKCLNDLSPERLQEFKNMDSTMRNLEFRELLPPRYRAMDRKTLLKGIDLFLGRARPSQKFEGFEAVD